MATSIRVEHVSKQFTLRHAKTLRRMVTQVAHRKPLKGSYYALDDVSFEVEQGQSIGLMGHNGSGKSTLLKLVSGVMRPDSGSVRVAGRIAGLLEVGAGFHPDLSGRDNIYLNAAILGMSQAEIDGKMEAIVDFAQIGRFIDTEVRHYSSGMFMRLGFAVSVHADCEVFLVDEGLAVGDAPFKRKCVRKIKELHDEGRTLFLVSHNIKQVAKMCDRALVLDQGRLALDGSPDDASKYLAGEYDEDIEGDDF
ncbi:MAG TPA: ABC transporter ATP-binding protein [Nocardioidaceae bacterium]|jgi:ABC-2 type transport system ATP-binding protein|nr:ABC transporter ATP-binding protein [Actinomycetota bacterium]MDQ3423126.1 ABC transporter ATP-binding protein [Actinomycetota bacterium]HEV8055302.1 ABC transporter ATP-binding protein [Nocardioidaceae bacterium]